MTYLIPVRVRRGALKVVERWHASPQDLVRFLETKVGFHTVGELVEALDARLGDGAGSQFHGRLAAAIARPQSSGMQRVGITTSSVPGSTEVASVAESALVALPDQLFNMALEGGCDIAAAHAFELQRSEEADAEVHHGISRLFLDNGVPYDFDDDGRLVPTGSAAMSALTLQPALDVLDDPRLASARTHLVEAQRRPREHDPDEAVDESRMAVEYGMLALLDATSTPRPARHQPNELFNALIAPAQGQPVLWRHAEELVLASARFRGRTTAGHAGTAPVEQHEAEAVVGAAAAALVFLAYKLP